MGGIKVQQPELLFKKEFAGRKAGHRERFSPDLAAQIVRLGAAEYVKADVVQSEPVKETKVKTSKKKQNEKNVDDTAV